MGPGAYHFGATYVGNKQTGPNEVQVVFYMYFHMVLGAAAIKGTPGGQGILLATISISPRFFVGNKKKYKTKEAHTCSYSDLLPTSFLLIHIPRNLKMKETF